MGGALYETIATSATVAIATTTMTGDICCGSDATKETGDTVAFCGGAKWSVDDTTNNVILKIVAT